MLRRVITWAVVIFIAFYLLTQPSGAVAAIHGLLNLLSDAGRSLATFANGMKW